MDPIFTRVGQIIDGDNRFFGRSALEEWPREIACASDALLVSLGISEITPGHREVMRVLTIALTSPDARVWPLKLTRLLASYGDALAGYFGAQLVTAGQIMGPGAGTAAALGLARIASEVGTDPTDAAVARAVASWRERSGGRCAGFGIPFRDVDERRVGIIRLLAGGPITRRPHWRLHEQVVLAMQPAPPNCAITAAAMLLDLGVAADRVGIALTTVMSHVFLAHALEAAEQDGARAHALPVDRIEFRGAAPRDTRATPAEAAEIPPALRRPFP